MPTFLSSSSSSSSRPQPSSITKAQQWLNSVTPLPRSSLSESALPSRRVILRSNNSNHSTTSSLTGSSVSSIRPSRFVKPTPVTSSNNSVKAKGHSGNDMDVFINLYEDYSQKVYMEGYLMHQDKKYFVELCGTTLALWDIEQAGEVVIPDYIPIMVDSKAYPTLRQQFTLVLTHKNKSMVFDTLDPVSLTKWICALHLARFERQLLNQYFTLHLFHAPSYTSQPPSTTTATSSAGYLQVLWPINKNEWKRLWVGVTNNNHNSQGTISKRSKFLHKQDPASSTMHLPPSYPQLILSESKKSKSPLLTLKRVDHAYAVYPESASLVGQSTLIRLEGVQHDDQPVAILLMAESSIHMTQWLSSLYNAFKLYGRPDVLVEDPRNPVALNFGERLSDNHETESGNKWWLNTEDITQYMDVLTSMDNLGIHQLLVNALQQKQASTPQQTSTTAYSQPRANSLPLITVESMDPPRQRSTSDAGILNTPLNRSALHSQIADSSDESNANSSDEDDDFDDDADDFDAEADSDDEPIGKSKQMTSRRSSSSSKNVLSSFLMPDFDFGNGFDSDRRGSSSSSILLSHGPSPTSSSVITQTSSQQQQQQQQQKQHRRLAKDPSQHSSGSSSTTSSSGSTNKRSAPTPPPSSSLFGDFSLTTDFSKYLDPNNTPSRLLAPDRKYSLPSNVKLYGTAAKGGPRTSDSTGLDRRNSSWNEYGWDHRSPRGDYLDEDYLYQGGDEYEDDRTTGEDDYDTDDPEYDHDGPLIPSLNDHFAPRNSLLDTHAGEQLSAKEQVEYARATGQPLIQVPSKPKSPKGGLVGVISQREMNRRQGNGTRVTERVNQHHANRFEREKERRILEQRQQQYMKHQIMMYTASNGYAPNRYVHPMMMHAYQSPVLAGPPPPLMSPTFTPSPYGRPYSPSAVSYPGIPAPSFNLMGSTSSGSEGLPHSRQMLSEEEDEDEPLCSPSMVYRTLPKRHPEPVGIQSTLM